MNKYREWKESAILPSVVCECGRHNNCNNIIHHEDNYYCYNCFRQILTPRQRLIQFKEKLLEYRQALTK